jgi:arginyl-tRNA synthetase
MRFIVSEEFINNYQSFSFGLLIAKKIDNTKKNSALGQIFDGLRVQIKKEFDKKEISNDPKITNIRNVYNEINAKTYKSSLENLLNGVLKDKDISFDNNLQRIRDYFMIKWQIPITAFSLDDIYQDIELVKEKKDIYYRDGGGELTKKWNSEQFERGSLNAETQNTVFIIENAGILSDDELKEKLHELALMVQKYCGGIEFEEDIIKPPRKEKDLGVQGLTEYTPKKDEKEEKNKESGKQESEKPTEKEIASEVLKSREEVKAEKKSDIKKIEEIHEEESIDTNSLRARLRVQLKEAAKRAYPTANVKDLSVEYPPDSELGDYACSIAMKLSKQLLKEPMVIAENIVQNIEPLQFIESVKAVGPGFINIKISRSWIESKIKDFAEDTPLYDSTLGGNRAVLTDYSSPNIAKPLGVHHLLSTVIGHAVYNIYKKLGYKTVGINHLGDWGTQFGKLIYAYKTWGNKKTVEKDPIPELLKLYVKFHEEAEQDPSLEDKARGEFKKLEEGNDENMELWKWFKELSIKELEKTYETLNIEFDEYIGESFYNDKMQPLIEEGVKKGVFKKGEEGALIVEFEDENIPPYMVRKSDGTTLYATRDLATIQYRLKRFNPSQILYVVDNSQSLHFKQLFETAKKLGLDEAKLVHVNFGRMHLPDRSMSTRKGNVVLLDDLIKQGIEKAEEIVKEKSADLQKKQRESVASKIALGSIKYNILSQNRTTDITFDWNKMLSLEGNSAPYLQYTCARAESILEKYNEMAREGGKSKGKKQKKEEVIEPEDPQTTLFDALERMEGYDESMKPFDHPSEMAVARLLVKFQEHLVMAAEEYKPNLLANYIYDVAREFNSFYNAVSVLQAESKHVRLARLNLTKATSRVLKEGMVMLGMEVPERM